MVNVKFNAVSKKYDDGFEAVKELNLEVNQDPEIQINDKLTSKKINQLQMFSQKRKKRRLAHPCSKVQSEAQPSPREN